MCYFLFEFFHPLLILLKKLEKQLTGNIAVKISTGEPGGHNFLSPNLIKDLVNKLNGTIVECNTAYAGRRNTTEDFSTTKHIEKRSQLLLFYFTDRKQHVPKRGR